MRPDEAGRGGSAESQLNEQGLPPNYNFHPDWEITPRQAKARLASDDDVVLIDCRTPQEYEIARIEGAVLVPLQEVGARLADLEEYEDRPVVIHCHHGMRSLQMAAILRQQGFEDVKSMAGGIDLWSRDIDPTIPRY